MSHWILGKTSLFGQDLTWADPKLELGRIKWVSGLVGDGKA